MYVADVRGHCQRLSVVRVRGRPARPTQPIRRAGTPATSAKSGTSRVTTAPAATIAQRPTVTGATHTARAPMEAPSRTMTGHGLPVVVVLEPAVRLDGAGEVVVGEDRRGADEGTVLDDGGLVDQGVVLDLHAVADANPGPM